MTRPPLRWALGGLYGLGAAAGIAWALRGAQWSAVGAFAEPRAVPYVGAAVACNVVGIVLGMVAWRTLLTAMSGPVPARAARRIYFVSFLGKYIPGRVWTLFAQLRLAGEAGVGPGAMAATFGLSLAVVTLTGLVAGAVIAPSLGVGAAWLAVPVAVFVLGLARPRWVIAPLVWACRLAGRPLHVPPDADRPLRAAFGVQLACWAVSGLHLWLLAVVLGADPLPALPAAVGGFALAMVVSSYAVVVPDGAGVREVLLALALGTVLPLSAVGVAVVASRLLCLVTEVGTASAAAFRGIVRTRIEVSHVDAHVR